MSSLGEISKSCRMKLRYESLGGDFSVTFFLKQPCYFMLLSFSIKSGWYESCGQYTRARICKKFGDWFISREAALKIRMGRAAHRTRMGRPPHAFFRYNFCNSEPILMNSTYKCSHSMPASFVPSTFLGSGQNVENCPWGADGEGWGGLPMRIS